MSSFNTVRILTSLKEVENRVGESRQVLPETPIKDLRFAQYRWESFRALSPTILRSLREYGVEVVGELSVITYNGLLRLDGVGRSSADNLVIAADMAGVKLATEEKEELFYTVSIGGELAEAVNRIGRVGDKRPYQILQDAIALSTPAIMQVINSAAERAKAEKAARLREQAHRLLNEAQELEA